MTHVQQGRIHREVAEEAEKDDRENLRQSAKSVDR